MTLAGPDAWREWLIEHEATSDGVWLRLARKGVTVPTSLTYPEAVEEALCSGWIDGQRRSYDATTLLQRFTPRRSRSVWSRRNVELIGRLTAAGRLRERGAAEVERARRDGRWDRAYAGPATAEVPDELAAALRAHPDAAAAFAALGRSARYSALHPILIAAGEATRERRIRALIERLQAAQ